MTLLGRGSTCALVLLAMALGPRSGFSQSAGPGSDAGPIVVVVHPSSPISNLSSEELRRLFLGSTNSLRNGERVELAGLTGARERFCRLGLGMSEGRFKRHWISRVFAGQPGTPPLEFRTPEDLLDFVSTHPGAVAFVDNAPPGESVKIVTVDGRSPGTPGYPLR